MKRKKSILTHLDLDLPPPHKLIFTHKSPTRRTKTPLKQVKITDLELKTSISKLRTLKFVNSDVLPRKLWFSSNKIQNLADLTARKAGLNTFAYFRAVELMYEYYVRIYRRQCRSPRRIPRGLTLFELARAEKLQSPAPPPLTRNLLAGHRLLGDPDSLHARFGGLAADLDGKIRLPDPNDQIDFLIYIGKLPRYVAALTEET